MVYLKPPTNHTACRRDLPNNGMAVMRLSPELKDLLDKMFEVKQVRGAKYLSSPLVPTWSVARIEART